MFLQLCMFLQPRKNFIFFYYFCKADEHHYLKFINKEIKEENQKRFLQKVCGRDAKQIWNCW